MGRGVPVRVPRVGAEIRGQLAGACSGLPIGGIWGQDSLVRLGGKDLPMLSHPAGPIF